MYLLLSLLCTSLLTFLLFHPLFFCLPCLLLFSPPLYTVPRTVHDPPGGGWGSGWWAAQWHDSSQWRGAGALHCEWAYTACVALYKQDQDTFTVLLVPSVSSPLVQLSTYNVCCVAKVYCIPIMCTLYMIAVPFDCKELRSLLSCVNFPSSSPFTSLYCCHLLHFLPPFLHPSVWTWSVAVEMQWIQTCDTNLVSSQRKSCHLGYWGEMMKWAD